MTGFTKLLTGKTTVSQAIKNNAPANWQFLDSLSIVVWNLTKKCNLTCQHCYIDASSDYTDELTTKEAMDLIDQIAFAGVRVILFSGGEPLLRKDLFELNAYVKARGLRTCLSSNGCLINPVIGQRIKEAGFEYVGISIDGTKMTHDRFRGITGAFDWAIEGIRILKEYGVRRGIRFTLNKENVFDLPSVIELAVKEGIERFCMYHLVYSGRATSKMDITIEERIRVIDYLIERTLFFEKLGINMEILTTDNHCDGVYIYKYIQKNMPEKTEEIKQLLKMSKGCSAGTKIINIGPEGNIYPCQFWQKGCLGNIRDTSLKDIISNTDNELLYKLKHKKEFLGGKCLECSDNDLCHGCRIRAYSTYNNYWAEDPVCYIYW